MAQNGVSVFVFIDTRSSPNEPLFDRSHGKMGDDAEIVATPSTKCKVKVWVVSLIDSNSGRIGKHDLVTSERGRFNLDSLGDAYLVFEDVVHSKSVHWGETGVPASECEAPKADRVNSSPHETQAEGIQSPVRGKEIMPTAEPHSRAIWRHLDGSHSLQIQCHAAHGIGVVEFSRMTAALDGKPASLFDQNSYGKRNFSRASRLCTAMWVCFLLLQIPKRVIIVVRIMKSGTEPPGQLMTLTKKKQEISAKLLLMGIQVFKTDTDCIATRFLTGDVNAAAFDGFCHERHDQGK